MARSRSRRRYSGLTRRTPYPSLAPSVSAPLYGAPGPSLPLWDPWAMPRNSASPLIRTVPVVPQAPPRWGGSRYSPVVSVKASGRSPGTARLAQSPFGQVVNAPLQLPERSLICARRGIRREVLFAQHKTGRGSRSPRRFTSNSKVRC